MVRIIFVLSELTLLNAWPTIKFPFVLKETPVIERPDEVVLNNNAFDHKGTSVEFSL
jgi:hypothetical protein